MGTETDSRQESVSRCKHWKDPLISSLGMCTHLTKVYHEVDDWNIYPLMWNKC